MYFHYKKVTVSRVYCSLSSFLFLFLLLFFLFACFFFFLNDVDIFAYKHMPGYAPGFVVVALYYMYKCTRFHNIYIPYGVFLLYATKNGVVVIIL